MYLCELGEDVLTGCYSAAEKICVVAMAVVLPFICTELLPKLKEEKRVVKHYLLCASQSENVLDS